MKLDELFISAKDTETHRVCGTCNKSKSLEEFYKDGKDNKGNTRYRRDCRDCYKRTRIKEDKKRGDKSRVK